jgi:integrase/recombinase XerD
VGSNPTLSAILHLLNKRRHFDTVLLHATVCMVRTPKKLINEAQAARAAHRALLKIFKAPASANPPIPREKRRAVGKASGIAIYTREKNSAGKWRYKAVRLGQGLKHPEPPFFLRYTQDFKQQFSPAYPSLDDAKEGAAKLRAGLNAKAKGITVGQMEELENINRVPIKVAIEKFLELKKGKAKTTHAAYELHLNQFSKSLKHVRFLDQIDADTMRNFNAFMDSQGLSGKTRRNRLMTVVFMLKKSGLANPLPGDELPIVEEEAAVAYNDSELNKLFRGMSLDEKLLFNFFLGTGCREKEVVYASWKDLDLDRGVFHVRQKPDMGFTPKSHESREVPLPSALIELLRRAQKTPKHPRWIFVNGGSKPDSHMLRRFKELALRAGLNCGHCVTTQTKGEGDARRKVEVSCKDNPSCEHWYLHRLRKTCATRWQEEAIPVRTIQAWLAHKDLNTTQKYLGVTGVEKLRDKINRSSKVR